MRTSTLLLAGLLLLTGLQACKTTSANYRAAYERATVERDSLELELDRTIYGRPRNDYGTRLQVVGADTVRTKVQHVRFTADGGGSPEMMHRYCVVAGQFRQGFNARMMRRALAELGYPRSFVVQTGEPYYYVVAASYDDMAQAANALAGVRRNTRLTLKAPCPFLLEIP